ncbi:MAG: hypothetical protein RI571_09795 [Roseovarius sp.]|nr:hypothetical protein [Roseovarius sp.]
MMPRWVWFLSLGGLVAVVAGLGLLLGGRAVLTTETAVIERVAARYVAEAGGGAAVSDCAARPARSARLWLVIACDAGEGPKRTYFVDDYGRVADRETGS